MANYCRSPVAERILQHHNKNYLISSAGIEPIYDGGMDKRSQEFLLTKGYDISVHTPRRINDNILHESSLILAMDHHVLAILNKKFQKFKNKFRLFTFTSPGTVIYDPYKFNKDRYNEVMHKIEVISKNLNLKDII